MTDFARHIRDVPDFPEPGVVFKDITPLLGHPEMFAEALDAMAAPYHHGQVDVVVGIEARGFIFGAPLARHFNAGFIPIRKPGKLPFEVSGKEYALEYGTDRLEAHIDAIHEGSRVLVVDDVLATGGTAAAAVDLVRELGGVVVGFAVLIELGFLNGRERLTDVDVHTVVHYGAD
ncbi:MAG: adenine phosphoribosyltransferase [Acidimicrobiia bacterium]|nr:adenine phosphoribosyltransferase [Acidimicrobiia bacterium]